MSGLLTMRRAVAGLATADPAAVQDTPATR